MTAGRANGVDGDPLGLGCSHLLILPVGLLYHLARGLDFCTASLFRYVSDFPHATYKSICAGLTLGSGKIEKADCGLMGRNGGSKSYKQESGLEQAGRCRSYPPNANKTG